MRKVVPLFLAAALAATSAAAGEPQTRDDNPGNSGKARVVGTIVGAAGGFALGLFTGLTVFDDAANSDRKVWTTAAASAVAGGVGGYFIGRAAGNRSSEQARPSEFRIPALTTRGVRSRSGHMQLQWPRASRPSTTSPQPAIDKSRAYRRLFMDGSAAVRWATR